MFERYTEKSRRAVFFARYVAGLQRAGYITTAHLLIGLAREGKTLISETDSLENRISELCKLVGIHWPLEKASKEELKADIPLDNNAKMALAYAAEESNKDRQFWIDTDHLLRGLLRFPNDASSALESIPLDLATARAASKYNRIQFPPKPVPTSISVRGGSGLVPEMAAHPFLMVAALALAEVVVLFLVNWFK